MDAKESGDATERGKAGSGVTEMERLWYRLGGGDYESVGKTSDDVFRLANDLISREWGVGFYKACCAMGMPKPYLIRLASGGDGVEMLSILTEWLEEGRRT